ncbi:uncharacterized protein MONOS_18427 [Monocercomonoides exilis]|uniref:uncharacterized protein n=1 Tax=Monocercomonoides exilis TaxID=2049356 RepID=UPI00355A949A|nr:hypothetical protein MONOS_18427 [Monocercomonoides exilis]
MTWGNSGVGARAPETKVTVCAQTVAARWAGCCWAPVYPSGWLRLMWAEWACGQWLQGWVVGVWLGWLAERCGRGLVCGLWAGPAGWAVHWKILSMKFLYEKYTVDPHVHRLIAPQGQVSETSRCHRGHANGAVGWACPAGTMWHTFGWWAVAGPRAVPEKVRIWESSRCHRETRSTLALSIGAIAIATPQLPLYLWSIY